MIKAEVVFDGNVIRLNKSSIHFGRDVEFGIFDYQHDYWSHNEEPIVSFDDLQDAIKYCLEN